MDYIKDFDLWNTEKKIINSSNKSKDFYIHEREVWWTSIGVNVGTEIDGKNDKFERPVLVVRKLGKDQFIGIPVTSRSKVGTFYHSLQYGNGAGSACISQLRVLSTNRLLRKIGKADIDDFVLLTEKLSKLMSTGSI
jgi:mRNA interferase MazF